MFSEVLKHFGMAQSSPGEGKCLPSHLLTWPSEVKQQAICISVNQRSCAKQIAGLVLLQTRKDD